MKHKQWDYHIHTLFSDGHNSISEMADTAAVLGLIGICFCDHCRCSTDWLESYAKEVINIQQQFCGQLDILCAVETKIIDHKGTVDVPEIMPDGIFQVAAIHRIPDGQGGFIRASEIGNNRAYAMDCWKRTVEGLSNNKNVTRLAHPFSLFGQLNIASDDDDFWQWLSDVFLSSNYLLENNVKYDSSMVPTWFIERFKDRMLPASDSHSTDELKKFYARLSCLY